ncbi:MAG: hypothetical protein VCB07_04090 [Gammaproteobacteria bacterium]
MFENYKTLFRAWVREVVNGESAHFDPAVFEDELAQYLLKGAVGLRTYGLSFMNTKAGA